MVVIVSPIFAEKSAVETYLLQRLEGKGWQHSPGGELGREDYSEPLLLRQLVQAVRRLNPTLELSEEDLNRVISELHALPASFEGSKLFLRYLKDGLPLKLEKTKELRYVKILDQENPENNEFLISDQVWFESSRGRIRPDLVLYVNGIPLVLIECKNPAEPGVSWKTAYQQVKRYEETVPELFKYVQFSIAAEAQAVYFPNVLGGGGPCYVWKVEGIEDPLNAVVEMLSKPVLTDILVNFTFPREEHGRQTKVLPRYIQYEAANRIFRRVMENLEGREKKDSGLIWHWQGSGKTLTMIFAAYKLYRHPRLANPTIFFVVDREELEEQLRNEFSYLDLGIKPEVISSVRRLKEILTHDEGRGQRGIFIVLIHKFREEVGDELEASLALTRAERETISNRRNVVVLIDEGHRTQYGKLAGEMRKILRKAFFFAFTGTPISKTGRDTYLTFSYPPEELYLHKYFIADSIEDRSTLPIVIQTRMEKEVGLKRDLLQSFLDQELEEIPEDFRERVKGKISTKLDEIVVFLTNPVRIEKIARDIAEHFKQGVDGRFKAMVVAANRRACVLYKRELDKHLPPEYSEVVMTFGMGDPDPIPAYHRELRERFAGKDDDEIRKEVIQRFKEEELPKILIVTDMLLTGFDAPILQVMYLDKPLKEHRLLQAIARTNRPCGEGKTCGLILDYVGIMKELEKAFSLYAKQDIKYAVIDLEEKVREFRNLLRSLVGLLGGTGKVDRPSLMSKVRLLFHDLDLENTFLTNFKRLRGLYEFLGPRYFEKEETEAYEFLAAVYEFYRRYTGVREEEPELESYMARYFPRTLQAIQKTLKVEMKEEFPELRLEVEYLRKLAEKKGVSEALYDAVIPLHRFVLVPRAKDPIYEPLIKKIERLVSEWRSRKIEEKEAYQRLLELVGEASELEKREREVEGLGLGREAFFILSVLERRLGRSEELLQEIKDLWSGLAQTGKLFEGWNRKPSVLREVMREVRRYLRKKGLPMEEREEICDEISKGLKGL
ncbi:MAG: hypothetical protein DSO04_06675 [Hadesarchaea archaeon]|nr:MAG: hypothetical protein DSO04_06675 [Hadesarchaea archaeon]